MKYNQLFNFVSPFSGGLCLKTGYINVGDERGIGYGTPILIYLKNRLLALQKEVDELDYLDYGAINLGNIYNVAIPTKLGAATLPLPQISPLPTLDVPIPNPTFNPAKPMDWLMSGAWMPQIFVGNVDSDPTTPKNPRTVVSSSLAMAQIKTARNFKIFDNANFIVASNTVNFLWDNPLYLGIDPNSNLGKLLALYDLGTTYTFTSAQSLGDLNTGLLKNTVTGGVLAVDDANQPILDESGTQKITGGTGKISRAIAGGDYVDTTTLTAGNLVLIDPLYPTTPNHKLIAPSGFKQRPNDPDEFGQKDKGKVNIFDGYAAVLQKLALTTLTTGALIRIGNTAGELMDARAGIDYVVPDSISDLTAKVTQLITIIKLVIGVKDTVDILKVTTDQASNLSKVVKAIGGIKDATDIADVAISDAKKIADTVKNIVGSATTAEMIDVATSAADVFTNKAALVELEAQVAALAGVTTINTLWNLFNTLALVGVTIGGKQYGEYIRGHTLNVVNTWDAADKNDECSNATGAIRPLSITPYTYEDRGKGTLWFDSKGRSNGVYNFKSEAGLRLFSWDSSWLFDNQIAPLHIGLFGYRKNAFSSDEYKGFILGLEFDNDSGSFFSSNSNYRFPKKVGFYDVYKQVSSLATTRRGFEKKYPVWEYDYSTYTFSVPLKATNFTTSQLTSDQINTSKISASTELNIPVYTSTVDVSKMSTGAIWLELI